MFHESSPTEIYTLSLHDALPICWKSAPDPADVRAAVDQLLQARNPLIYAGEGELVDCSAHIRSEEHTSELQSRVDLVCRLLREKKKNTLRKRLPRNNALLHQRRQ